MESEQVLSALKSLLGSDGKLSMGRDGQILLELKTDAWLSSIQKIYDHSELRYRKLKAIAAKSDNCLWAELGSDAASGRLSVFCIVANKEKVPSLATLWPMANWLEQEVFNSCGLKIEGTQEDRLLRSSDGDFL